MTKLARQSKVPSPEQLEQRLQTAAALRELCLSLAQAAPEGRPAADALLLDAIHFHGLPIVEGPFCLEQPPVGVAGTRSGYYVKLPSGEWRWLGASRVDALACINVGW